MTEQGTDDRTFETVLLVHQTNVWPYKNKETHMEWSNDPPHMQQFPATCPPLRETARVICRLTCHFHNQWSQSNKHEILLGVKVKVYQEKHHMGNWGGAQNYREGCPTFLSVNKGTNSRSLYTK